MALFRTAIASVVPGARAKEHAALVAEHAQDARETEALALTLRRDIERDDERCAQLRASLDDTTAHRYRLQLELSQLSRAHERRCTEREHTLRELADSRIEALLEWIGQELSGLARQLRYADRRGGIDPRTGRAMPMETVCANWEAVQLVSAALSQARERAEALKVQSVPDLAATLEEIRRAVPSLDQAERRQEVA